MNEFDPTKLRVTFFPPATPYKPIDERKYTLMKSHKTGEYFLTIGYCYDSSLMSSNKEILAEWVPRMGQYILKGKVSIRDENMDEKQAKIHFLSLQKELRIALFHIVYGDYVLYQNYPWLLDSPIYIQFESSFAQFQQLLYCGTPRQYLRGQSPAALKY